LPFCFLNYKYAVSNKYIVEGKVTRKQQKAIVKNVEVEKDNLDNCNRGNINMNMNNGAEDIPCVTNGNLLQNEHAGSEGSRLSTCSKKVPISRNKDLFLGNMKRGVYPLQTKENLGKREIRNGNCTKSSTRSINHSRVNQNNITIYHQHIRGIINKTEELLLSFTSELPHVICLSEHHLKDYEINTISLKEHILASQYSRKNFR
jgi:hypothetical protein